MNREKEQNNQSSESYGYAKGSSFRRDAIANITFHDLRHDFAHRAREAGWTLEEVAYYLGHVTKIGTPAIQTTARYAQVSRKQVKEKLKEDTGITFEKEVRRFVFKPLFPMFILC